MIPQPYKATLPALSSSLGNSKLNSRNTTTSFRCERSICLQHILHSCAHITWPTNIQLDAAAQPAGPIGLTDFLAHTCPALPLSQPGCLQFFRRFGQCQTQQHAHAIRIPSSLGGWMRAAPDMPTCHATRRLHQTSLQHHMPASLRLVAPRPAPLARFPSHTDARVAAR
jgi:hypothetical protein